MEKVNLKNIKILGIVFILISIFYIFYASCSLRALYLDGSSFFIKLLDKISNGDLTPYWDINHPRFQVVFITELPLIFAGSVLKVSSKTILAVIYSFACFSLGFLGLWWNYELTKRTKQYAILFWSIFSYAVVSLLFQIFIYVETIIGLPYQFVLLNYLFGKIHYTKRDKIGIAFILFLMFGIYEHTIIVGTLIFIGMFLTLFDTEDSNDLLVKILIGTGSFTAAIYTFFFALLNRSEHSDFVRFIGETFDFWHNLFKMNLVVSVATVLILIILLFKKKPLSTKAVCIIGIFYLYAFLRMITFPQTFLSPMWEQHTRSIVCWTAPLMFFGIVLHKYLKKPPQTTLIFNAFVPVLFCGITLTAWQIVHTFYWNQNISYLKNVLQNYQGTLFVPEEHEEISSFFNENLRRYVWRGNFVTTALAFDENYKIKTLLLHYNDETKGGDDAMRDNLYTVLEKDLISVPYGLRIRIKNKFWDLTDCAHALDEYNSKHNIKTNKPENPDDVIYP